MAYIGNSPANVGNYAVVDDIASSFNGTTTSFALTSLSQAINPAKSGQLLVSVNGVLQEPDDTGADGFKVSGSNIVFSSAPASGSTFWCVYQGQTVDVGVPSDNTVGTIHLKDSAVSTAKIASDNVNADKLAVTGNGTTGQYLISDGDGTFSWSNEQTQTMTRTLPSAANDCVELGYIYEDSSGHSGNISVVVSQSGISISKKYMFASQYGQQNSQWVKLLPITSSGDYGSYDFDVETYQANGDQKLYFRLRHSSGSGSSTAFVTLTIDGTSGTSWTNTSATYTASTITRISESTLISQENGYVTMPYQPAFEVNITGSHAHGALTPTWGASWEVGSNVSTTNKRFTAPVAGTYHFDSWIGYQAAWTANRVIIYLSVNGSDRVSHQNYRSGLDTGINLSANFRLEAGDYVGISLYQDSGATRVLQPAVQWAGFGGYLIG